MPWPRIQDGRILAGLLTLQAVLAWWALWHWGDSPYGHLLMHGGNPGDGLPVAFIAGWTLMTVAMMLPTSSPLILLFYRMVRGRRRPWLLIFLLIAGYLAVWIAFGVAAHFGQGALSSALAEIPWLVANPWVLGAAVLLMAGLYQFSPLKYSCLDQCRSPMSFLTEHWRGGNAVADSLRLGVAHGLFCVGCCWSLMVLMFLVGSGSLGWMLALGAVMAAEKNLSWGRRLAAPLGAALVIGRRRSLDPPTSVNRPKK